MAVINLRRYYPHYPKDKFIEVPDDVAGELKEGRRIENRQNSKRTYYMSIPSTNPPPWRITLCSWCSPRRN